MKKNEPIEKIMTKEIVTILADASVSEVKNIFTKHGFRHLPVLEGEKVVGIITSNDMLKSTFSEKLFGDQRNADAIIDHSVAIIDIMTANPVCIKPETTIREASQILQKESFNALPVVDNNHHILGIVTTKDLVKFLLDHY